MKRILISLLSLLLALAMLAGCASETPSGNSDSSKTPPSNTDTPPTSEQPFLKTEGYMPADVFSQMKSYFESTDKGFYPCDDLNFAPLVSTDVFAISNATVKSITIPVFSTGKADTDGNLTFSLHILSNDWATLREELKGVQEPIVIKVNAAEHGLEENKIGIRKFIKVDLTDYNITLTGTQTLGFSAANDTLIPARVLTKGYVTNNGVKEKYVPAKYLIDNWDVVGYYYHDTSIDNETQKEKGWTYTDNSLFFDFELERTYKSESAYNELQAAKQKADDDYTMKIAALKAAYAGKSISLIGDSISTFGGITNDPMLGLSDNPVYTPYNWQKYPANNGGVYTYERTYWGKLAAETDMELCVINSWGGGKVYGWPSKYQGKDGMLLRSYNLAKGNNKPDVILLNFGINDMGGSYSSIQSTSSSAYSGNLATGNLYQRLTATNKTKTDKEIVAEWFAEVEAYAAQGGFDPTNPATITYDENNQSKIYTCWEAAYALSLQNIKRLYPDAEVFCITLPDRNHSSSTQPRLDKANLLISALAEYFELGLVDQANSGVTRENCIMYSNDNTGLHPNGKGHAALTKAIVDALYEKLPNN